MSILSCSDVCEEVHIRLDAIGFEISEEDDHTDVLEALSQIEFVRAAPPELKEARLIAEEVLYALVKNIDLPSVQHVMDGVIGEQLDLTDEAIVEAWETIAKHRQAAKGKV